MLIMILIFNLIDEPQFYSKDSICQIAQKQATIDAKNDAGKAWFIGGCLFPVPAILISLAIGEQQVPMERILFKDSTYIQCYCPVYKNTKKSEIITDASMGALFSIAIITVIYLIGSE